MAIVASLITQGGSNTNATGYTTASVSPTSGRPLLLIVNTGFLSSYSSTSWPSFTVTGLGLTWTQHHRQIYFPDGSNFYNALYVFRAIGTITPGSISLTSGQTLDSITWALIEFQDANTNIENLIVQSVGASYATGRATTSLTLAAFASSENATLGIFVVSTATNFTVGSGLTELSDVSGEYTSTQVSFRDSSQTEISADHVYTNNTAVIGLEIQAAGGAASSLVPFAPASRFSHLLMR